MYTAVEMIGVVKQLFVIMEITGYKRLAITFGIGCVGLLVLCGYLSLCIP